MAYEIKEEICLDVTRTRIVACDSPQAHFKLTPPRATLSDDEAGALGLLSAPPLPTSPQKAEEEAPEEKAVSAAPANKAVAASSNKGRSNKK